MIVRRSLLPLLVTGFLSLVGCAATTDDAGDDEGIESSEAAVSTGIAFQTAPLAKDGAPAGVTLVTTGKQFEQLFGVPSAGIDFTKEWLVHYSLGPSAANTTISASRLAITGPSTNKRLLLTTKLSTPAAGCAPAAGASSQLTVRFKRQVAIRGVDAAPTSETVACPIEAAWANIPAAGLGGWVSTTARTCLDSPIDCYDAPYSVGCVVEMGQKRQITCYRGTNGSVTTRIAADGSFAIETVVGASDRDAWDLGGRITADRRIHIDTFALHQISTSNGDVSRDISTSFTNATSAALIDCTPKPSSSKKQYGTSGPTCPSSSHLDP